MNTNEWLGLTGSRVQLRFRSIRILYGKMGSMGSVWASDEHPCGIMLLLICHTTAGKFEFLIWTCSTKPLNRFLNCSITETIVTHPPVHHSSNWPYLTCPGHHRHFICPWRRWTRFLSPLCCSKHQVKTEHFSSISFSLQVKSKHILLSSS